MLLSRLLPNLGGPQAKVRRLYANTVLSVSFYGTPVWAVEMMASRRIKQLMHAAQQQMAVRITRSYRCPLRRRPWRERSRWSFSPMPTPKSTGVGESSSPAPGTITRQSCCQDTTRGPERGTARVGVFSGRPQILDQDHRGHPPLSARVGGQGMGRIVLSPNAGTHRARLLRWVPLSHRKGAHNAQCYHCAADLDSAQQVMLQEEAERERRPPSCIGRLWGQRGWTLTRPSRKTSDCPLPRSVQPQEQLTLASRESRGTETFKHRSVPPICHDARF